ncbi:DUF3905 domain-containing protein [Fodinisporobacter ferrooxydans]|uniref:DUF3905 domain-containing protein n=1 Tax=Fodinisporobacter ferrooxydans TaxID=2901836 RepID=A0ABY4CNW6_9BACL|nr:DUF3905 domain-containing protein [Alicyclobacillaceae bacterium MYW30-H2]
MKKHADQNFSQQNADTNQLPLQEKQAPWRNTPLDYWSTDIDPAILSGDQWVDDQRDPGFQRRENQALADGDTSMLMAPFMHPVHDVTYGIEERES